MNHSSCLIEIITGPVYPVGHHLIRFCGETKSKLFQLDILNFFMNKFIDTITQKRFAFDHPDFWEWSVSSWT